MGPEVPGQLAIWLALVLNIAVGGAFLAAARGKHDFVSLGHRAYYAFAAFTALAVIDLYYLFFTHNYAFKYVYDYSERSQPFFYIVSAFWGGQEGTYLLWLAFSVICGFVLLRRAGIYRDYAMVFFSLVNLFFIFLMLKISPFALLDIPQADGMGLNPLLRDPWMVIHPPVIFVAYAMCGVPFALAMAALAKHDYSEWVKRAFPWVAGAAFFLALGNILGGYWAYKTLGWGGYWAWDPVENSSMVPWMISVAFLHGLLIERRTGAFRKSNLLLAAFLFMLVVYGTFLTRSGVLSDFSVHSFVDLGINGNLVMFMAFYLVVSMVMFFWRARSIEAAPINYNFFGKEFSLVASVIVLFLFGVIVMFWSSLPILSGWFSDKPYAAEIATYNSFALPLASLMAFLITLVPLVKFSGFQLQGGLKKSITVVAVCSLIGLGLFYLVLDTGTAFAVMFSLIVSGMIVYLFNPDFRKPLIPALIVFLGSIGVSLWLGVTDYMILLFYATAAMCAVSNVIHLASYFPNRLAKVGAPLTHFGFGVMLVGVMASSAFDSSERLAVSRGETVESEKYGFTVTYNGMMNDYDFPNNELMLVLDEGSGPFEARPQLYYSRRMDGLMRRPFISRSLGFDLYFAPQQIVEGEQQPGLVLKKGVPFQQGDMTFTLQEFEVGSHGEGGGMTVAARIDVAHGDEVKSIVPKLIHSEGADGTPKIEREPATLEFAEHSYQATIKQILADQAMVILDIPGLTPSMKPERLILDVSKKPMISLVWVGTTLMLLGSLAAVFRRRSDLIAADATQSVV